MPVTTLVLLIAVLSLASYRIGSRKAIAVAGGHSSVRNLHSLPGYYGLLMALWCAGPALVVVGAAQLLGDRVVMSMALRSMPADVQALPEAERGLLANDIRNLHSGAASLAAASPELREATRRYESLLGKGRILTTALSVLLGALFSVVAWRRITPILRARNEVERGTVVALAACASVAVLTTIGIVMSIVYEAMRFFAKVPITQFLFGTHWSPQMALSADQVGSSGSFGAVPLFTGTLLVALIAMAVAVPVGLFAAIYLSEYANRRFRTVAKPLLETLAGIPTVVYGFFAALTVGPALRDMGVMAGLNVSTESALSAGLVMGIMIIPFISSLADDMITAVPRSLRDGSLALGATNSETIRKVVLPAALPGIAGGVLLAVSRAIGETMIVVMAAGLAANLTANPFQAVTTVTVQIVTLLVGDQEFDSPKTLVAFALGLTLFIATLLLNILALQIVRRYREQYD